MLFGLISSVIETMKSLGPIEAEFLESIELSLEVQDFEEAHHHHLRHEESHQMETLLK